MPYYCLWILRLHISPVVHLTAIMAGYLKLGQPVRVNHTPLDEGEWVRVTEGDEKNLLALRSSKMV